MLCSIHANKSIVNLFEMDSKLQLDISCTISLPYWTPVSHIHSIIKCPVSGGWGILCTGDVVCA